MSVCDNSNSGGGGHPKKDIIKLNGAHNSQNFAPICCFFVVVVVLSSSSMLSVVHCQTSKLNPEKWVSEWVFGKLTVQCMIIKATEMRKRKKSRVSNWKHRTGHLFLFLLLLMMEKKFKLCFVVFAWLRKKRRRGRRRRKRIKRQWW